jgi:hypothetical protein
MLIKQVSVFIENKEGRLEKVTEVIQDNNINIISASLADSSEYGMLRLIVSNPEKAKSVLKEAGFSAKLTEVIAVKLPKKIGMLHQLCKVLVEADISIEYMYVLSTGDVGAMIIKVSNMDKAIQALFANYFEILNEEETYNIN